VDGSGTSGHSYYSDGNNTLTFFFDAGALGGLPTHVGVVWTDVGLSFSDDVFFRAYDADDNDLGLHGAWPLGGEVATSGQTAEDRFLGAIHGLGISRIDLIMSESTDWEMDHVQYGRETRDIPAPAAAALIPAGLIGLIYSARRRSRSD
jgi:hypothetical protein